MVCKILAQGPLACFMPGKPNYDNLFFGVCWSYKRCGTKFHAESTDREPESSVLDPIRDKTLIWTSCGIFDLWYFLI